MYNKRLEIQFLHVKIMQLTENKLLQKVTVELQTELGSNLKQLILYGSRARGDFHVDSDYDLLAIMGTTNLDIQHQIIEVTSPYLDDMIHFSVATMTENSFQDRLYFPFVINVRHDGIPLLSHGQKSIEPFLIKTNGEKISLMPNDTEILEPLQLIIIKAKRSLRAGKNLYDDGDYDFSASRSYYAVFYGVEGILLTKQLTPSKHIAAIRLFNQYFVHTGIFPKSYNNLINLLFQGRLDADYNKKIGIIPEAKAEFHLKVAEEILTAIISYLQEQYPDLEEMIKV